MSVASPVAESPPAPPAANVRRSRAATVVWALPLLIATLIPGMYLQWAQYTHAFRWIRYANATFLVALVGGIVLGTVLLATRSLRRALSVAGTTVFLLFTWPLLTRLGDRLAFGSSLLSDLIPVLVATALIVLAFRMGDEIIYPLVTGGLMLVMLSVMTVHLVQRSSVAPLPAPVATPAIAAGDDLPDVLLLVLDGYARGDVLAGQFGFDNSPFLDGLEDRGFAVSDGAVTAYDMTFASLASMLSLGYPLPDGPVTDEGQALVQQIMSGDNALFDSFDDAGYDTVYLESDWDGMNCNAADRCIRAGMTAANAHALSQLTIFRPLVSSFVPHPTGGHTLRQLELAAEVLGADDRTPVFAFAHVPLPHPPLPLDAGCEPRAGAERGSVLLGWPGLDEETLAARRGFYTAQIECINARTLAAIDAIQAAEPDAIVIVTADHGPDGHGQLIVDPAEWEADAVLERFAVLLAVHMPARCGPSDVAMPTNATRRAVDCALGSDLGSLEVRSRAAPTVWTPIDITDMTDRVSASGGP